MGQSGQKLQHLFVLVCCLVTSGGILDYRHYNNDHSGINFIAFMLIFLYTYYQYTRLRQHTEEVLRLTSLMALELVLIVLNGLLMILFFTGNHQKQLQQTLKIAIGILQYHKIYMIISVMTYFP